jgi:hypothetical protein
MIEADVEQWFLQQVNASHLEQKLKPMAIEEIGTLLKQPFSLTN